MIGDALRRWTMRSVSMGVLLFGYGVGCKPEPVLETLNDCADMPMPPELVPKIAAACKQMIAIDSTMTCPSFVDGVGKLVWQGEQLFNGSTADLGRYCRYTWVDPDPASVPDPLLVALPRVDDCTFITPQSWPASFDEWAHNEFIQSVTGERAPTIDASGLRTRVVVLDTFPDGPNVTTESHVMGSHGETLAHLIQELACGADDAGCATEVTTRLVMPWRMEAGVPRYHQDGGDIGRLSDVARGMWLEMERFRQELQNAADALTLNPADTKVVHDVPTRLVFNESFAFGGDRCAGNPDNVPENARALFKTFQAAACLGAAHVAAAGNHTGGEAPGGGLLCPARWDHAVLPTIADCENLFGVAEFSTISANFKKVTGAKYGIEHDFFDSNGASNTDALMSVGAVDFSGVPIVMTRPNACPEAVALGVGAADLRTADAMQPYLFGTSVSAAVVSARIAAKWSQNGEQIQNATAILQTVSNDSQHLGEYHTGGACEHLASEVCNKVPWIGAPLPNSMPVDNVQNPSISKVAHVELLARTDDIDALGAYVSDRYTNDNAPLCTARIPQCVTENATAAAANVSTLDAIIWPQPTDPVCLRCGITFRGANWVELWLDPSGRFTMEPGTNLTVIKDAALVIGNETGEIEFTIPLKPSMILLSSVYKIEVPVTTLKGRRAWISAYDDQGNSFSQQIFVIP